MNQPMDIVIDVIRKYVSHPSCREEIFDQIAEEASRQLGGADLVLICECFVCNKIDNPSMLDDDSGSSSELSELMASIDGGCSEVELHTLGSYATDPSSMQRFKQDLARDDKNSRKGWIRPHRDRGAFFLQICQGNLIYITEEESKANSTLQGLPKGHPAVRNVIGVPLCSIFDEHKKGLGVLVVANFSEDGMSKEIAFNRLRVLSELLRLVLSGYKQRRMKSVFASVVDNIQTPIIVFQQPPSTTSAVHNEGDLRDFRCLVHNKAFTKAFLKDETKDIAGGALFQCFPQLQHTDELMDALVRVVSDSTEKRSTTIEVVEYEDMLVDKNVYTIKFSKVDAHTFVMSIENISDQLRAKMLAEEIAQAKEQFVANVSHEIRTPLNGILGYIAMMSDPKEVEMLTDYQRNCFNQIKDCSMNLLYIMNDILDFSKLNADQMTLNEVPFELSELLEKSYDVILPSAHDKGIEGAFLIDPNVPPRLKGDFKKLRQVLLNLLTNGVKFTHRGRVDTTVKLVHDEATHSDLDVRGRYTLEFCISDTGIGISPRNQSKLFKAFTQIDQSNKKIYQGTGLGLVISKKIIELMGGKIWVESEEGEGSRFFFTIKMDEARATSSETQTKWLPLLKDKNVLVVDDHATNRITIASHLVQWGMKPMVCGSAEEALLYIRGGVMHFDLALLDMRMPKMDGNELANKIMRLEPSLPLVAISSVPLGPREINRYFSFYISKPIKHRQLFNVCLAIIKRANARAAAAAGTTSPQPPRRTTMVASSPPTSEEGGASILDPELNTKYTRVYHMPEKCKHLNRSFLIAEDLYTNQRVAIGFLEKLGFHDFTVAEDGDATLQAVQERHFDVILMDLKMPRCDGYEATRRIRQFYRLHRTNKPQPFIIALTANAMGGVRAKCAEAGMDAYVSKPIDMSELADILNDAV